LPDLILIAVPDSRITEAAIDLATYGWLKAGGYLLHTAGAFGAEVLAFAVSFGTITLAFHPLQTITERDNPEILHGILFGLDGSGDALEFGEALAAKLGGQGVHVPADKRIAYHIAAVFAGNLIHPLLAIGIDLLSRCGIPETEAEKALTTLSRTTTDHIGHNGLSNSITGPLARRDIATLQKHCEYLKSNPDVLLLYRQLSDRLLSLLPPSSADPEIRDLLNRYTGKK